MAARDTVATFWSLRKLGAAAENNRDFFMGYSIGD
jgi:hypothetical protein